MFGQKLFSIDQAFDHPLTLPLVISIGCTLAICPVIHFLIVRIFHPPAEVRRDMAVRYRTWLWLAPLMAVPVLAGAGAAMLAIGVLCLGCYAEFARATGVFRDRPVSVAVVLGIGVAIFAALDHWYGLFVALASLVPMVIAVAGLIGDRPRGYLQRVGLGALGSRKLVPQISPNKTWAGAMGALVGTTILFAALSQVLFASTPMASLGHGLVLGALISVAGQCGDLVISAIKRDIGLKDMGTILPGHGGVLDRFDSLILAAPVVFHYVGYFSGIGLDQPVHILTAPHP